MGKDISKITSKNWSGKYSPGMSAMRQKIFDHAKNLQHMLLTSSERVIQKTAEVTNHMIGNNIANKITRVPKNSQQNN